MDIFKFIAIDENGHFHRISSTGRSLKNIHSYIKKADDGENIPISAIFAERRETRVISLVVA